MQWVPIVRYNFPSFTKTSSLFDINPSQGYQVIYSQYLKLFLLFHRNILEPADNTKGQYTFNKRVIKHL